MDVLTVLFFVFLMIDSGHELGDTNNTQALKQDGKEGSSDNFDSKNNQTILPPKTCNGSANQTCDEENTDTTRGPTDITDDTRGPAVLPDATRGQTDIPETTHAPELTLECSYRGK